VIVAVGSESPFAMQKRLRWRFFFETDLMQLSDWGEVEGERFPSAIEDFCRFVQDHLSLFVLARWKLRVSAWE